jgi:hypothetical protein
MRRLVDREDNGSRDIGRVQRNFELIEILLFPLLIAAIACQEEVASQFRTV